MIRRYAVVKVIPAQCGGYWIDVAVYKELEDMRQPEHGTAGSAVFRNDTSVPHSDLSVADTGPPKQLGGTSRLRPPSPSRNGFPKAATRRPSSATLGQIFQRFTPEGTPGPVN